MLIQGPKRATSEPVIEVVRGSERAEWWRRPNGSFFKETPSALSFSLSISSLILAFSSRILTSSFHAHLSLSLISSPLSSGPHPPPLQRMQSHLKVRPPPVPAGCPGKATSQPGHHAIPPASLLQDPGPRPSNEALEIQARPRPLFAPPPCAAPSAVSTLGKLLGRPPASCCSPNGSSVRHIRPWIHSQPRRLVASPASGSPPRVPPPSTLKGQGAARRAARRSKGLSPPTRNPDAA